MMENSGVTCDVCACVHHCGCDKCSLPEIRVTEQSAEPDPAVETPHFCCNFEKK